jgi:hypothetical protein
MDEEDLMKAIVTILLIGPLLSSCDSSEVIYENFLANLHESDGVHLAEARGCGPLERSKVGSFRPTLFGSHGVLGLDDKFDGERLSTSTCINQVCYVGETRDWASLRTWETWTMFVPFSDNIVLGLTRWASPQCSTSDWDEKQNGILDGGVRQIDVADEAASGDVDAGSYVDSTLRSE